MAGIEAPFTDLSAYAGKEKERETREAMRRGDTLIYAGRIRADGLLGVPDLLRREGSGYLAGDVKSGAAAAGKPGPGRCYAALQLRREITA